ncbi:MAG TPA: SOS response-associated peptidase [Patescibacteria group bacterium]
MCGRYAFYPGNDFFSHYDLPETAIDLKSNYNVSPGYDMPVVVDDKTRSADLMHWGLVPSWADDPKIGFRMINARSESLSEKPAFKRLLDRRRCLIPANGFYEWLHSKSGKKPYYFFLKSKELISFAGLYDSWQDPLGRNLFSYTIITTSANSLVSPVHDRMPVIIPPENEDLWVDTDIKYADGPSNLLKPFPDDLMASYPVSPQINSASINDSSLIRPLN